MNKVDKVGFGEMALVNAPDTTLGGAIIKILAGKQTDTVFHRTHGKIVYVLYGKLRATVMKDGRASATNIDAGNSFFVRPGLVHNFYGIEETTIVEFAGSDMYVDDVNCIFKGTPPETAPEATSTEDVMKVKEEDKVVEPEKTKKKRTTKSTKKTKTRSKKSKLGMLGKVR